MSYSGRHRYTSRREKYEKTSRNLKIVVLFAAIATVILIWKNRYDIISYVKTYFM